MIKIMEVPMLLRKTLQQDNRSGFALTGGKTYTFVAYSLRANSAPPTVTNGGTGSNISNAKLSAISGDLMYFKKT